MGADTLNRAERELSRREHGERVRLCSPRRAWRTLPCSPSLGSHLGPCPMELSAELWGSGSYRSSPRARPACPGPPPGLMMLLVVHGLDQGAPSSPRALLMPSPLLSRGPSFGMSSALCPAPGSSAALPSPQLDHFSSPSVCPRPPWGSSRNLYGTLLCRGASTPSVAVCRARVTLCSLSFWALPLALSGCLPSAQAFLPGPARCPPSRCGFCYFSTFLARLRN